MGVRIGKISPHSCEHKNVHLHVAQWAECSLITLCALHTCSTYEMKTLIQLQHYRNVPIYCCRSQYELFCSYAFWVISNAMHITEDEYRIVSHIPIIIIVIIVLLELVISASCRRNIPGLYVHFVGCICKWNVLFLTYIHIYNITTIWMEKCVWRAGSICPTTYEFNVPCCIAAKFHIHGSVFV